MRKEGERQPNCMSWGGGGWMSGLLIWGRSLSGRFFLRWSQMVLTQCDCRAVLWMSKWFLCLPVYFVLLCRARARASACLVHHYDFSSVCSCVLPCVLWLVCLLFEAFDLRQWFHVFFCFSLLFQALFETWSPTWYVKQIGLEVSKSAWNRYEKQKTWNHCGRSKASKSRPHGKRSHTNTHTLHTKTLTRHKPHHE